MSKRLVVWAILIVGIVAARGVSAKPLDDLMSDVFEGMITQSVSGSESGSSQGRMGYYYGGSYQVRIPTYDAEVVHITPPNLKTGCNGIDANFGAVSFLNGDDLKVLLRRSVQQGATYAFGLALQAICGSCLAEMKALAAKVNKLSADLLNSCEAGRLAVNSLLDAPWGEDGEKGSEVLAANLSGMAYGSGDDSVGSTFVETVAGMEVFGDYNPTSLFDGEDPFEDLRSIAARNPVEELNARGASGARLHPELSKQAHLNIVHSAITKAGIVAWWDVMDTAESAANKEQFYRFLTSIYGTTVFYPKSTTEMVSGAAETKVETSNYRWNPVILDLAEMLPSNGLNSEGVVAPGTTMKLETYVCINNTLSSPLDNADYPAEACLAKAAETEEMNIVNVAGLISGYIDQLSDNVGRRDGTEPSGEVKAFMVTDPFQSATLLEMAGAQRGPIAKKLKNWSAYTADKMFYETLKRTHEAVKNASSFIKLAGHKKQLRQHSDDFAVRLAALDKEIDDRHKNTLTELNGATIFIELIKDKRKRFANKLDVIPSTY
jgi:hypothetical protein